MESQYHQFGASDNSSVRGEHKMPTQAGETRTCPLILIQ